MQIPCDPHLHKEFCSLIASTLFHALLFNDAISPFHVRICFQARAANDSELNQERKQFPRRRCANASLT